MATFGHDGGHAFNDDQRSETRGATMLPTEANLCGTMHRVGVHEGLVVFSPSDRFGPCWHSYTFDRRAGCWYVTINGSSPGAMVAHLIAAQNLLDEWYGPNHYGKNGENNP